MLFRSHRPHQQFGDRLRGGHRPHGARLPRGGEIAGDELGAHPGGMAAYRIECDIECRVVNGVEAADQRPSPDLHERLGQREHAGGEVAIPGVDGGGLLDQFAVDFLVELPEQLLAAMETLTTGLKNRA